MRCFGLLQVNCSNREIRMRTMSTSCLRLIFAIRLITRFRAFKYLVNFG